MTFQLFKHSSVSVLRFTFHILFSDCHKSTKWRHKDTSIFKCARRCSCSGVFNVLSNWSSSCSFLAPDLSVCAVWAGLATEAETAAHQPPYATAAYHSSQLLNKSWEFEGYKNMPMIYSKYFSYHDLFIRFNVAYQWEEKNKLKPILWCQVLSETIFILKITSLQNVTALKTLKSNWSLNSTHFLCKEI